MGSVEGLPEVSDFGFIVITICGVLLQQSSDA